MNFHDEVQRFAWAALRSEGWPEYAIVQERRALDPVNERRSCQWHLTETGVHWPNSMRLVRQALVKTLAGAIKGLRQRARIVMTIEHQTRLIHKKSHSFPVAFLCGTLFPDAGTCHCSRETASLIKKVFKGLDTERRAQLESQVRQKMKKGEVVDFIQIEQEQRIQVAKIVFVFYDT